MGTSEQNKLDYIFYKSIGLCPSCRRNKPQEGNAICDECLEKRKKYYEENIQAKKIKNKAKYERLKAAGLCTTCGKEPARPGNVRCEKCAQRYKEYYKKKKMA